MSNIENLGPRPRIDPNPKDILKKLTIPPLKLEYRREPIFERIHLSDLCLTETDDTTWSVSRKISAQVMDMTDKVLMGSIISAAREEGVNDLFLIDKEFIITAIKNELARRQEDVC